MTKLSAVLAAATLLAASSAYAESTAPVAVTQADTMGSIANAQTYTAAAIVLGGAIVIENSNGDDDGDSGSTTAGST